MLQLNTTADALLHKCARSQMSHCISIWSAVSHVTNHSANNCWSAKTEDETQIYIYLKNYTQLLFFLINLCHKWKFFLIILLYLAQYFPTNKCLHKHISHNNPFPSILGWHIAVLSWWLLSTSHLLSMTSTNHTQWFSFSAYHSLEQNCNRHIMAHDLKIPFWSSQQFDTTDIYEHCNSI